MPRDGTIVGFEAFFSNAVAVTLTSPATVLASLYVSESPDSNVFNLLLGPGNPLTPAFNGLVTVGATGYGSVNTGLAVSRGQRILVVFTVEGTTATLTGLAIA